MTDLYSLLSLPQTSKAFTARALVTVVADRSGSPLRKVARLDTDSDSASASRPKTVARPAEGAGSVSIRVLGHAANAAENKGDKEFTLVKRCVRVLLARDSKNPLPANYEQIYRSCRAAVTVYDRGESLYADVKIELQRAVGTLARELFQNTAEGTDWLVSFINSLAWFEKQAGILQSVLAYLDRVYVPRKKGLQGILRLAYELFAEHIFNNSTIVQKLHAGIKAWADFERTQGTAHELRDRIPVLIRHLFNHGQYRSLFEAYYVEITESFYTAESANKAEELKNNAQEFLHHSMCRRTDEEQRAKDVLPESSRNMVVDTASRALLAGRLEWLAKEALGTKLDVRDKESLAQMYHLFALVDGLKVLSAAFKLHVQTKVREIVKDAEHDEEMVPRLLEFKAFTDDVIANVFVDEVVEGQPDSKTGRVAKPGSSSRVVTELKKVPNKDFAYAVIDAFQSGFKARRNKPAEMIAKHLDKAMRKGQKGKKDEDFQAELDAALGLYRFTDDKDVFRTFYHRALAKRLLLEKSASDDFEKAMLKRLKEQYDPEFGMGDHMFNDLALSRDRMREYMEHRARLGDDSAQNLSVMVLQRSFWPFASRKQDAYLPQNMQEELARYTQFYKNKHSGHKLDWDHALGTATLRARFKNGEKELTVSLYQALVLLLFNEAMELTFEDIKSQTHIEDAELRRTLQSLALGKKRVLKKSPVGKDVNNGDVFSFNADFTDPRYQVHINSIQAKETAEENKRTQTSIEGDRKHALDAAIVRVMKAKNRLHYEQLKTATIDAVKNHFVPEMSVIKQRIQGLVEQEYLRRDDDDMNIYLYVA